MSWVPELFSSTGGAGAAVMVPLSSALSFDAMTRIISKKVQQYLASENERKKVGHR